MNINRRTVLGGGAFAATGAIMGVSGATGAQAAAPAAGKQINGVYRYKVGDFEVTAISDGVGVRKLEDGFIRNVPLAEVQKELAANFLPTDELRITFTTLVVNTGSKLVVIDSGFADNGGPTNGMMGANLAAAGINAANVDIVLISHFHGDHIQGVRKKDSSLVYPNAEIKVPAPEWAFWMDDAKMAAAPEGMKGGFAGVRRVFAPNAKDITQYEWDKEVAPGITAIAAPGHTPGHTGYFIQSGNARLLVASDCTNSPALNLRNPEWKAVFDMDADQAIATRRRIFDMAASERTQVAGYHWPFPSTGYVVKDGARYQLVPVAWSPVL